MKLVALPDLHDRGIKFLANIAPVLQDVDCVLLPGDMTNGNRGTPITEILQAITKHTPNVLAVPGNWDYGKTIDELNTRNINLHGTHHIIDDLAFYGAGGALPYIGYTEFSEADYAKITQNAVHELDARYPEIFVCHNPPFNTLNDYNYAERHVGSHTIRKFIEKRQPHICFTGHIHEGIGIDTIGKTQIINPGPIWQTHAYAYAEVSASGVDVLEIRKF